MPMSSLRERLLLIDNSSRALAVSFLIRTEKILYPSSPRSLDFFGIFIVASSFNVFHLNFILGFERVE